VKRIALPLCVLAAVAFAGAAAASQVISTSSVGGVTLQLNDRGEALLTYQSGGKVVHVLAWGAVNASATAAGGKQVAFDLDYSGGYAKYFLDNPQARALAREYRRIKGTPGYLTSPVIGHLKAAQLAADDYWKTFHGGCGSYDGPTLAWLVVACKAPDGSYWAVQEWQRKLPDYGEAGTRQDDAWEVHLSHWTGSLPVLTVYTDWAWHRWNHLYGTFTYDGEPVFGLQSSASGRPLDSFGRNVYLDTFDSAYGAGWKRENSFLTHKNDGVFCYSVNPHPGRPAGTGTRYRATIMGPGVTPDVMWEGPAPSSSRMSAQRNIAIAGLHDPLCKVAD
jgi:hypothetical protein